MDAKTLAGAVLLVLELGGDGDAGWLKGDCANTPVGSEGYLYLANPQEQPKPQSTHGWSPDRG